MSCILLLCAEASFSAHLSFFRTCSVSRRSRCGSRVSRSGGERTKLIWRCTSASPDVKTSTSPPPLLQRWTVVSSYRRKSFIFRNYQEKNEHFKLISTPPIKRHQLNILKRNHNLKYPIQASKPSLKMFPWISRPLCNLNVSKYTADKIITPPFNLIVNLFDLLFHYSFGKQLQTSYQCALFIPRFTLNPLQTSLTFS